MDVKQKERYQRGEDFQNEIRRGWRLVPNSWRRRVVDGQGGGTQPADEIILLLEGNVLAEHKRRKGDRFSLNELEPNQQKGLLAFDAVLPQNYGLVFISFLDAARGVDETYVVRFVSLARYLRSKGRVSITRNELMVNILSGKVCCILTTAAAERTYDLRGLGNCLKFM
ncbi:MULTISPECIES: hypothetical protein [Pelosinus]|uniref:Phage protein n=1 Tax=Pelosinus fermentans B4 TaxID=1149862 RepID=I8RMB9_9FIRM|nr:MULTISPECIES: hypothetical protein [Pelosinus]EIW19950.1 phage protein [Pelosinus fermentans B4]EIW21193.1 phage protein [Pelosinus fermentans A11]